MAVERLPVDSIVADPAMQPRAKGIDEDHVADLKAAYEADEDVPRPVVWKVGTTHKLSQGFHRLEAAKRAGITHLECEVHTGTDLECALDAFAGNQAHGLKRTNEDKRRAAAEVLKLCPGWTNRRIADALGVSDPFVGSVRDQLLTVSNTGVGQSGDSSDPRPRTGKDGKTYPAKKRKKKPAGGGAPAPAPDDPLAAKGFRPVRCAVTEGTRFYPRVMTKPGGGEVVIDAYDQPVPAGTGDYFDDPTLRDLHDTAAALRETAAEFLDRLKREKAKPAAYPWADFSRAAAAAADLDAAAADLLDLLLGALPYAVCPDCRGHPKAAGRPHCTTCRAAGYWPKAECDRHPDRMPRVKRGA